MNDATKSASIRVFESPEAVAKEGAQILLREATHGKNPAIALSGGSTPKTMYEVLRKATPGELKQLHNARYFFGDERSVDNYHSDSNVALAVNELFKPLKMPYHLFRAPDGAAADLDAEAARLTHILHERLNINSNGTPVFDLIFLGMGTDGHTASLFPGTSALESDAAGYVANRVESLNTWRLTLTMRVINAARHAVILCTGENKATVLQKIFPPGVDEFPIQRVRAARVTWLLDSKAASLIPAEQIAMSEK